MSKTETIEQQPNGQFGIPEQIAWALNEILEYLWADEQRHFIDCGDSEQKTGHIFLELRRVRSWLDGELKDRRIARAGA